MVCVANFVEEVQVLSLQVPGVGVFSWQYLVLDLNGTLTVDGELVAGVPERLTQLGELLEISLLTADTRGTAQALAKALGVACVRLEHGAEAEQKARYVASLGAERVIAIGNGQNDAQMLARASLGIAVLGSEGASFKAMANADIVVPGIVEALDLLLKPARLLATWRQ